MQQRVRLLHCFGIHIVEHRALLALSARYPATSISIESMLNMSPEKYRLFFRR